MRPQSSFNWQPQPTDHQSLLQDREMSEQEFDDVMTTATEKRPVVTPRLTKKLAEKNIFDVPTNRLPPKPKEPPTVSTDPILDIPASIPPFTAHMKVLHYLKQAIAAYLNWNDGLPKYIRLPHEYFQVMRCMAPLRDKRYTVYFFGRKPIKLLDESEES
jgi:hypothetical protein